MAKVQRGEGFSPDLGEFSGFRSHYPPRGQSRLVFMFPVFQTLEGSFDGFSKDWKQVSGKVPRIGSGFRAGQRRSSRTTGERKKSGWGGEFGVAEKGTDGV